MISELYIVSLKTIKINPTNFNSRKLKTMKKITILFSLVALFAISSLTVNAQVSAVAETSANIVGPISITKSVDMSFGNVAVSPTVAGTVVLDPLSTRTQTGGVTLPVITGTVTAAKFTVSGESGTTYSISLPASISLVNGGNTMTVDAFTSTPTPTGSLASGTEDIFVGGTLNVAAAQASGLYTNTSDLVVTVNYN